MTKVCYEGMCHEWEYYVGTMLSYLTQPLDHDRFDWIFDWEFDWIDIDLTGDFTGNLTGIYLTGDLTGDLTYLFIISRH